MSRFYTDWTIKSDRLLDVDLIIEGAGVGKGSFLRPRNKACRDNRSVLYEPIQNV